MHSRQCRPVSVKHTKHLMCTAVLQPPSHMLCRRWRCTPLLADPMDSRLLGRIIIAAQVHITGHVLQAVEMHTRACSYVSNRRLAQGTAG